MSQIAMCDNCGEIFSLNEEGWETYTRQARENHPHSNMPIVTGEKYFHMCPECAVGGGTSAIKPRLALHKKGGETHAELSGSDSPSAEAPPSLRI